MNTDDPTVEIRTSFRLMGSDLEPDEVTRFMGVEPGSAHRKGAVRPSRAQGGVAPYREGLWAYSPESAGSSLEAQLVEIIELIRPKSAHINELVAQGVRADVFVGVFSDDTNVAISINPIVLAQLGALGLRLELDVYFDGRSPSD